MPVAIPVVLGCLACIAGLILCFRRPLLLAVGKRLVQSKIDAQLAAAGLVCRPVALPDGTEAWIRERPASRNDAGPPLLVLPGATVDIDFMGARVSGIVQALPGRRVVIIELPYHGRNRPQTRDFSSPEPSMPAMAAYIETVRTALGISEPVDLLGYSLGGGLAAQYAIDHGDGLRRLALLAPFFFEACCDTFSETLDREEWRSIHGWETVDEMLHFFHQWLGMPEDATPPSLILDALHAMRTERYPAGYWSDFFTASDAVSTTSRTLLRDRADDFAALGVPTLVVTGRQDAVCDPVKLARLPEIFGPTPCTVTAVDSAHVFAGSATRTIFHAARDDLKAFLEG